MISLGSCTSPQELEFSRSPDLLLLLPPDTSSCPSISPDLLLVFLPPDDALSWGCGGAHHHQHLSPPLHPQLTCTPEVLPLFLSTFTVLPANINLGEATVRRVRAGGGIRSEEKN